MPKLDYIRIWWAETNTVTWQEDNAENRETRWENIRDDPSTAGGLSLICWITCFANVLILSWAQIDATRGSSVRVQSHDLQPEQSEDTTATHLVPGSKATVAITAVSNRCSYEPLISHTEHHFGGDSSILVALVFSQPLWGSVWHNYDQQTTNHREFQQPYFRCKPMNKNYVWFIT